MKELDNLTVTEIKNMINDMEFEESIKYIEILLEDKRKSVNKIAKKIKKQEKKIIDERNRIEKLWEFENELVKEDLIVAGIDEVGRGPLAGPVVTAAVILNKNDIFWKIDDSKKVKKEDRERLYEEIMSKAVSVGIGIVDEKKIDEINILEATKLAMKKAIENLKIKPELLLIDAVNLDDIDIKQISLIKGDSKSISIACASIIAKVTRDKIMYKYDEKYPGYGFSTNVGYGTEEHRNALKEKGYTEIHRKTFIKNLI